MSIIVKGEPMPEACAFCPCFRDDSIDGVHAYQCKATFITYGKEDDWIWNTRPNWCPLLELPEKHGRLIEEKEIRTVMNWLLTQPQRPTWNDLYHAIQEMNAILEAEGVEE